MQLAAASVRSLPAAVRASRPAAAAVRGVRLSRLGLLGWMPAPAEVDAAAARVVRARRLATEPSAEPSPEPELAAGPAKWWQALEIEEMRQDLAHDREPDDWDDVDDSWLRAPQPEPEPQPQPEPEPEPEPAQRQAAAGLSDALPPLDRGWTAWLVVLASFTAHIQCLGSMYTFTLFVLPYREQFGLSAAAAALPGSLATGVMLASGPAVGRLVERCGSRSTLFVLACANVLGLYIVSVADTHAALSAPPLCSLCTNLHPRRI